MLVVYIGLWILEIKRMDAVLTFWDQRIYKGLDCISQGPCHEAAQLISLAAETKSMW
jgi:hypothetical protein